MLLVTEYPCHALKYPLTGEVSFLNKSFLALSILLPLVAALRAIFSSSFWMSATVALGICCRICTTCGNLGRRISYTWTPSVISVVCEAKPKTVYKSVNYNCLRPARIRT